MLTQSLEDTTLLEIGEEAVKYHYSDQDKVDFGQWKKDILFVIEFGYPTLKQVKLSWMHRYW